jgi:hypothetical protein
VEAQLPLFGLKEMLRGFSLVVLVLYHSSCWAGDLPLPPVPSSVLIFLNLLNSPGTIG